MSAHVVGDLHEYALKILDAERSRAVAAHLRECRSCLLELGAINDSLVESMTEPQPVVPGAGVRARLLADVGKIAPYSRYLDEMARLLQGSRDKLERELRGMPHPKTWLEGPVDHCRLFPCDADSQLDDAIRSLVLMESGSEFPVHEHLGDEYMLILQGSLITHDGTQYRPGEQLNMLKGTSHGFEIPSGLDLIYFNVVHSGLKIGEQQITPASLSA